jgi:Protein of unknown function (DUF2550)
MGGLLIPLEVVGALLLVLALFVGGVVARRRWLSRRSGSFDCSLRTTEGTLGKGWQLGVARYEEDRIEWFRVFAVTVRPNRVLQRGDVVVQDRRYPRGPEAFSVMAGSVILRCRDRGRFVELAMSEQASTGFASWLEAAPPGQNVSVA